MNKYFILIASFAFALSSCTDNEVADKGPDKASLTFKISAVKDIKTRRTDLYSPEAVHNINNVRILVYDVATQQNIRSFYFDGWTQADTLRVFTVDESEMLSAGNYRFIAVGFPINTTSIGLDPVLTESTFETISAYMPEVTKLPEVFAGNASANLAANPFGTIVEIELRRVVAGIMGYFKNVPARIGDVSVRYLRLSVSNRNEKVLLYNAAGTSPTGQSFNLIDIDFSGREVQNGYYASNTPITGVEQLPNSQLSGCFYNPINGITMKLGLYDDGGAELKSWDISLDGTNPVFNLQANHFYSMGRKLVAGTTTGTDEENPDDDDNAIDLANDQNIIIYISPEWDDIHDLVFPSDNINTGFDINLDDNNWDGIQ